MAAKLASRLGYGTLFFGGVLAYGLGASATYTYITLGKSRKAPVPDPCGCGEHDGHVTQEQRLAAYAKRAKDYDRLIGRDETFMGITLLRRALCRHARGDVLEVGAGTSRNLEYVQYYGDGIKSVTLSDASPQMLEQARLKAGAGAGADGGEGPRLRFQQAKASDLSVFPDASFDTVIDSFGLCSYDDPVKAVKEMRRVCKPGGNVLLLEHGRSTFSWLNKRLDDSAEGHALSWGCHWNKDIVGIVKEAGIRDSEVSRYHFGTTVYVVHEK